MNRVKYVICEDIPAVARTIKDRLTNELKIKEEEVVCFHYADHMLNFFKNNICDNIIIDLAMDSTGLPQKQRSESEFSKITGWIILKNYIINGSLKDKLKDTNCYIFSGYGNIFSETLGIGDDFDVKKINEKLKQYRGNLYFFQKRGTYGGVDELIEFLKNT